MAGQFCLRLALLLGVVFAVLVPKPPVAAAVEFFPGFDVTCHGGWSCAGAGYSDASASWADTWYYRIHNCTRYAAYRLAQNGLANPGHSWGYAWQWGKDGPVAPDNHPAVGAIAWWDKGTVVGGGEGHVAYVEDVGDGSFVETEDNAGPYNETRRVTVTEGSQSWPSGFLHIPSNGGGATPAAAPAAAPAPPAAVPATAQQAGTYSGTIGGPIVRMPATLTLTNSDPISGTIDVSGICAATWTESQRMSDSSRTVQAHVTSGGNRCQDNQWVITINAGQINGVDTSHSNYTVSLMRQ